MTLQDVNPTRMITYIKRKDIKKSQLFWNLKENIVWPFRGLKSLDFYKLRGSKVYKNLISTYDFKD